MLFNSLPKQRISFKEKGKQWRIDCMDYLCTHANNHYIHDFKRMVDNYNLHNNIINQEDFQKYVDPLGLDAGQGKDFVQAFNKTHNKIQVLRGEELRRPWNYHVIDYSRNATNEVIREKQREYRKYYKNVIETEIQKVSVRLQMEAQMMAGKMSKTDANRAYEQILQQLQAKEQEVLNPEAIERKFKSYKTSKEKLMSKLLRSETAKLAVRHKKNEAFFDLNVAGIEAVLATIVNGEPYIEILNPLGIAYHKSPEIQFFQDGDYVVYKREMSLGQIFDLYGDDLAEKDLERINERLMNVFGINAKMMSPDGKSPSHWDQLNQRRMHDYFQLQTVPFSGGYGQDNSRDRFLVVYTAFWKSYRKVGFLFWDDEDGKKQSTLVPEEFPIPENAKTVKMTGDFYNKKTKYVWTDEVTGFNYQLLWEYIPEVWEGTKFSNDIYLNIRPYPYTKFSLENPFRCKLPIFGTALNNRNSVITAPMDRMKPWQRLYLLVMSKWLNLITQDKGMIQLLNLLMIDKDLGPEKTMQYAVELGYLPYNPLSNAEGAGIVQNMKASETLNLSNIANIRYYTEILNFIDNQIGDAAGISKPREGQTSSNTNVGDNRQDLLQSAVITEPQFAVHDLIWEEILNELVYLTQRNIFEKGGQFSRNLLSDEEIAVIELDGEDFINSDLGIRVSNNGAANAVLDNIKSNAQALIQNDKLNLSTLMELLSTEDLAECKMIVKDIEADIQKREEALNQSQMQNEQKLEKMRIEAREDEQAHEVQLKAMEIEGNLERERIKAIASATLGTGDADTNDDGIIDVLQLEKLKSDERVSRMKQNLEERKQSHQEKIDKEKIKIEREKMASQEKIARAKASQAKKKAK